MARIAAPVLHYPRIRIVTPAPVEGSPWTPSILTMIYVDDEMWPIVDYRISGQGVDGIQRVMLVFEGADVTIEHPEDTDA